MHGCSVGIIILKIIHTLSYWIWFDFDYFSLDPSALPTADRPKIKLAEFVSKYLKF